MKTRVIKKRALILLAVVAVPVGLRAALPGIVKSKINAKLARVEGWKAAVRDVDLAVLRGSLVLHDLEADGKSSSIRLSVARAAVNISWGALLRRKLIASVEIVEPKASLTVKRADREKAKGAAGQAKDKAEDLFPNLKGLFPFRLDRLAVRDGAITVKEGELETNLTGFYFIVDGLTNFPKKGDDPRAKGEAGATVSKDGTVRLDFRLSPAARPPAFDFALAVKKIDLPEVNPLLRAQFGMDVDAGDFELVAEATSAAGGFNGYVKPFVKDLKMGPTHGKKGGPMKVIKEAVVGAVAAVLKNDKTDAVAAKVPFEGRYDNPEIGVWEAFFSVLRNAFVKALTPTFE